MEQVVHDAHELAGGIAGSEAMQRAIVDPPPGTLRYGGRQFNRIELLVFMPQHLPARMFRRPQWRDLEPGGRRLLMLHVNQSSRVNAPARSRAGSA